MLVRMHSDSGLKEVAFSPVLKSIGDTAFQGNGIKTVVLPDTLTSLGRGCIYDKSYA